MADGGRIPATLTTAPAIAWRTPLIVLGLTLLALGILFAEEAGAAIRVWESSTAYNHCWLILPISGWLAWQRRHRLAEVPPHPMPAAAALMIPAALAWLLAERLGIMEGRQLVAVGTVWIAVLAVAGWRFALAFAAPLAYLIFAVPFGAFATPALQHITAQIVEFLLGLTSIPHYVDDLVIEIPAGTFLVAEACAGLRFLVAALAFGALYALVMFRSPWRRLVVMVLALVVPIVANGARAFGLVMLGHFQGSAAAVEADHVIYGWGFFSVIILLLILAGLPFRQDGEGPGPAPALARGGRVRPRPAATVGAGLAVTLLAAAGVAAAAALDRIGAEPLAAVPARLGVPERCEAGAEAATLACPGATVRARLLVFPARTNWSAVAEARHRAFEGGSDVDVTFSVAGANAAWQGRQSEDASRTVAVAGWLAGAPAGDGLRSRAMQAWNALQGGTAGRPVLVILDLRPDGAGSQRDRDLLRAVIAAQDDTLAAQAATLSRGGPTR